MMQMKNWEPALSRCPGTSTADTAPRVFFSVRLKSQNAQPSGAVFGLLRRILR